MDNIKVLKKTVSADQIRKIQIVGQELTSPLNEAKKLNLRAMTLYLHLP